MPSPSLRLPGLPRLEIRTSTLLTVVVLAAFVLPLLSAPDRPTGVAVLLAVLTALALILSVLGHEIAHALVARAFGGRVDHIALTFAGGHTQYHGEKVGTLGSLLVSLAGPAANLVLAGLAAGAAALLPVGAAPAQVVGLTATLNVALAVFNLLPGLPMDGGRALETALGAVLRRRALGTRITAVLGMAIAVLVVLVPLYRMMRAGGAGTGLMLTLLWAVVIASMLWQGASAALRGASLQERIDVLTARDLARRVPLLRPQTLLGELPDALRHDPDALAGALVLAPAPGGGAPRVLRIDVDAARGVPAASRPSVPVTAVAAPLGELGELPAGLAGDHLVEAMMARPHPVYLVREDDGTVLGVIIGSEVAARLRGR
ncbi:site-2 protease family protein [Brachybacterium rhamnosum]|uniref:Site-2 protease family protein n=1 Tax=Brachybacterium rhamnosum TaxID=173361 RepID=A0ABW4PZD0_9MICO